MIICYNVPEIWHLMDVTFIFSFCAIFCTSTPLKAQKTKSQKKRKKHLEISSFYTNIPKITIICYNVPEIWRLANANFIFYLGPFCVLFPPATPVPPPPPPLLPSITVLKIEFFKKWKMKKTPGDIIILHILTKIYDQMMYGSWDMVRDRQTDRRTDGAREKVTYRGGWPT